MGNGVLSTPNSASRLTDSAKSDERRRNSFHNGERRKAGKPLRRPSSTGGGASSETVQEENVPRPPGKSYIRRIGVDEVSQLIGGQGAAYAPYIKLFVDQQVDGEFLCRLAGTEIDAVMEIMGINDGKCIVRFPTPYFPLITYPSPPFVLLILLLGIHKFALKYLLEIIQWLANTFGNLDENDDKTVDNDEKKKEGGGFDETITQLDIIMRMANSLFTMR